MAGAGSVKHCGIKLTRNIVSMTENINENNQKIRVACFIDGFNLYHALDNLGKNHLKWVNLRLLMEQFTKPDVHNIVAIYYFSAVAEWLKDKAARHKIYISALESVGITPILGEFRKDREHECFKCGNKWLGREEKQTDVNIAVCMIKEAFRNKYDQAILVSRDSDYVPALKFINELPRKRQIKIISPPNLMHSKDLCKHASKRATIKEIHLENSLFPEIVKDSSGNIVATRPKEYDPPT